MSSCQHVPNCILKPIKYIGYLKLLVCKEPQKKYYEVYLKNICEISMGFLYNGTYYT